MKKLFTLPALALLAAGACLPAAAAESSQPAPQGDQLGVVRDADTGKLRAPTAEEAQRLATPGAAVGARAAVSTLRTAAPQALVNRHAGGAVRVRLTEEMTTQLVATRVGSGLVQTHMPATAAKSAAAMRAEAAADQQEK